jgi:tetratricopeptide (TPR) repeat protein
MDRKEADAVARAIAATAEETGLGFLFARLAVDEVLAGQLKGEPEELEAALKNHAFDLLLNDGGEGSEPPSRPLLQALALGPPGGLPLGEVWETACGAIDPEVPATQADQLQVLSRFGRFIIEERHSGETLYRWFHPALRRQLRDEAGPEAVRAVVEALVSLRDRKTEGGSRPEQATPFLLEQLPRMIIEVDDPDLIARSTQGAAEPVLVPQVRLTLDKADEEIGLGNYDAADSLIATADLLTIERDDALRLRTLLTRAEYLLRVRDSRDASRGCRTAFDLARRLLAEDRDRVDLLEHLIRATRLMVDTLPGEEKGEGAQALAETLSSLAEAEPSALATVAPSVAKLLLSYSSSLSGVVEPATSVSSAEAASRICGWLMQTGREDLRPVHAESLAFVWLDRMRLGKRGGARDFQREVEFILSQPVSPRWMTQLGPLVGELTQWLGWDGEHKRARELLDRAIEAYRPAVEAAEAPAGYPLILGSACELRSTVLAALGLSREAEQDAIEAVQLAVTHAKAGLSTVGARAPLSLRLLEREQVEEVAILLSPRHPLGGPASSVEGELWGLALGLLAIRESDPARGVELLESVQLHPDAIPLRRPRPSAYRFNSYGLEFRIGLALREGHLAMEQPEEGERAMIVASGTFLRREILGSPRRLTHLHRDLFEASLPWLWAEVQRLTRGTGEIEPNARWWASAIEVAAEGSNLLRQAVPPQFDDDVSQEETVLAERGFEEEPEVVQAIEEKIRSGLAWRGRE